MQYLILLLISHRIYLVYIQNDDKRAYNRDYRKQHASCKRKKKVKIQNYMWERISNIS